ncbi:MAG TPA: TrpB-like pyridoxal-phosphate dependent enzyme, partial [Acidimicrobiia bacterium]|nr:TrpB-like pyridoxal-phosphate dependent enzyme [Acidimicrobiia bacterium]
PEPSHAIAAAVREAELCREKGESKVILTALCGHGHFDMGAYRSFLDGNLEDFEYPEEKVREAMAKIPNVA